MDASIVRRDDYVRLLLQALNDLGFANTAEALTKESNVTLQSDSISQFCESVLEGNWALVEKLLAGLELRSLEDAANAKFLIYEQQYLELLEQGKVTEALECLRSSLTPLKRDYNRVHRLTSLMMCTDVEEIRKKASWDGSAGKSRSRLLEQLRRFISSHTLLPERRLENLVLQAVDLQKRNCTYHNLVDDSSISLFEDHVCTIDQLPSKAKSVLQSHSDEVWFIQYSHNGKFLASVSKDKTAIIWGLEDGSMKALHVLAGHNKEPSYLSWSPNDEMLVTVGSDNLVKLWDTESGICLHTYTKHTKAVTACAWLPDNKHFVSGGLDVKIYMWDINGDLVRTWAWNKTQINDLVISPNGRWLAVAGQEKKVRLYDIPRDNPDEDESLVENAAITSLSFSNDSRYILVNVTSPTGIQEIHLWDVDTRQLAHKYSGHKQSKFVIRSNFGGAHQGFIVSGSEDFQVYIWNRSHEQLLQSLAGHTGMVNSVAWNPVNPYQLASASDDHTIRIWESEYADEFRARQERQADTTLHHKKRRRKGHSQQNGFEENGYASADEEGKDDAGKGKEHEKEEEEESSAGMVADGGHHGH